MEAARSDLKRAEEDFIRTRDSYFATTAAKAEMDAALAVRDRALGMLNAAKARHAMMKVGSRPEDIAESWADFLKMKAKAEELEAGTR